MPKKEYSLEETLEELGITRPTLKDWMDKGIAPSYRRVDKYTIFDAASVKRLKLKRQKANSNKGNNHA